MTRKIARRIGKAIPIAAAILLIAAAVAGCKRDRPKTAGADTRKSGALMTCLALVRAHHRQADFYLELGEPERAIQAVERILELSCPEKAPEVAEALLDAHSRLATLQLKQQDIDGAERTVTAALKRFRQQSFFMAHLLMVKADVMEARAKKLKEQGKEEKAKQLMRDAIKALSRSIKINRTLQKKLVEDLKR